MLVLAFALAALIGASLGLMGGGGSILTVPVFVYLLGFAAKPAIAMSLPVVGATSLAGAISHWRAGNVEARAAFAFGLIAMTGSYLGARVSVLITGATQLTLLSVVILAAAILMMWSSFSQRAAGWGEDSADKRVTILTPKTVVVGLVIGVLTGVVGVGGGFLIVPALVIAARVPIKQAIGTSLLVIAMNSAAGFAGYYGTVDMRWEFVGSFTAFAIAGILVGTYLTRFLSGAALQRGFSVLLLLVGCFMLYQNAHSGTLF